MQMKCAPLVMVLDGGIHGDSNLRSLLVMVLYGVHCNDAAPGPLKVFITNVGYLSVKFI